MKAKELIKKVGFEDIKGVYVYHPEIKLDDFDIIALYYNEECDGYSLLVDCYGVQKMIDITEEHFKMLLIKDLKQ